MKKIITIITVLTLFGFGVMVVKQIDIAPLHAQHASGNGDTSKKERNKEDIAKEQEELTHQKIVTVTDKFMELLVQEIDDHYRVLSFNTKEELIKAFNPYIKKEAVKPYVDFYYKEKEDGLYIVPTETPPWFVNDVTYEKRTLENGNVQVTQHNKNALDGAYTIKIDFKYIDNAWKIVNISE